MENTSYQPTDKFTFEQVWAAFMESRAQLDRHSELLRQTREILDQKFQETNLQLKESELKWAKERKESERKWAEELKESERKRAEEQRKAREEYERMRALEREERRKANEEYERKLALEREEEKKAREEYERVRAEVQKKSDREWAELRAQSKETDRMIQNLSKKMSDLDNNWGKFVEALVDGALIDMLSEAGIKIQRTSLREKGFYDGRQFEFDIIAKNGDDVVIVEVKTTLSVKHVQEFIKTLEVAKEVLKEYSDKRIFGAIAFIHANEKAEKYSESKGLFVIKAVGKSAKLLNASGFKPKEW